MKDLKSLIALQLRDKVDLSWIKNKQKVLRNLIFFFLKFGGITFIVYILLLLSNRFGLFSYDESPSVVILVIFISLILSLINCTIELMKTLFFGEDNKVLITFPVKTNTIYISKIAVYFVYELKKSLSFLIPITLGCIILLIKRQLCSIFVLFWMWIPLLFIIVLPVLLGALLSIPLMFLTRQLRKNKIIEFILIILGGLVLIVMAVYLINLIPENIDLLHSLGPIKRMINNFLKSVENNLKLIRELLYIIIGKKKNDVYYTIGLGSLLNFGLLIVICLILVILVYLISRPLFFKMMAYNFENDKNEDKVGKNKKHSKYFTFIDKELKINLRTTSISINYILIYIIVPILTLLLNKIFVAMESNSLGLRLKYTFNILLVLLPMLASNALIATYYSREARAGYIKKTKPIQIIYPLLAKLFFNIVCSIPSIIISCIIFGAFNNIGIVSTTLFILMIIFTHLGHMIFSATLDIMHPQNEQYATTGITIENPNETKSTLIAFIIAFVFAIIGYKLLAEAQSGKLVYGFLKLSLIAFVYLLLNIYMFRQKIKAYYYEIQGN